MLKPHLIQIVMLHSLGISFRQLTATGMLFTATDDLVDALTREDALGSQENPGTSRRSCLLLDVITVLFVTVLCFYYTANVGSSTTPKVNITSNISGVHLASNVLHQPSSSTEETSTKSGMHLQLLSSSSLNFAYRIFI